MADCSDEYKKFIADGDLTEFTDCYYKYPVATPETATAWVTTKNAPSPIDQSETCKLINTKKTAYYKHTYDPEKIITDFIACAEAKGVEQAFLDQYIGYMRAIMDDTKRENCCNCISLSLYHSYSSYGHSSIMKYLISIERTVKNVQKELPDWLVRIYLDLSVFRYMKLPDATDEERAILDFIMRAENTEVFTYVCNRLIPDDQGFVYGLSQTRSFRFMPLIDEDVNITIIRDADGIVTNNNCHNIQLFEESSHLFYIVPFLASDTIRTSGFEMPYTSYSFWLSWYKAIMEQGYFAKKNNAYDLLAGTFGTKIKVKKELYYNTVDKIKRDKEAEESRTDYQYDKAGIMEGESSRGGTLVGADIIQNTVKGKFGFGDPTGDKDEVVERLYTGFDEILLLELYKDLISFEFVKNEDRKDEYDVKFKFTENAVKIMDCVFMDVNDVIRVSINNVRNEDRLKSYNDAIIDKAVRQLSPYVKFNDAIIRFMKEKFNKFKQEEQEELYEIKENRRSGKKRLEFKDTHVERAYKGYILHYIIDAAMSYKCLTDPSAKLNINSSTNPGYHGSISDLINEPFKTKYAEIYDDMPSC